MNVFPAKHDKFQLPLWLNALLLTLVKMEAMAEGRAVFDPMSWRVFCGRKSLYKANNSWAAAAAAAAAVKQFGCRAHLISPGSPHMTHDTNPLQRPTVITENELCDTGKAAKVWQFPQRTWAHSPRSAKHYFKQVDADVDVMKVYRFSCFLWNYFFQDF